MQVVVFCKHINLAQQRLKFSPFEGSEIIQNQP